MNKLKLKDAYKGIMITRNTMIGKITFDSTKVNVEEYINFFNLGFEELFEEIIEVIEPKKLIIETPKSKKK